MNPLLKALVRPPAVIVAGIGLLATVTGWWLLGLPMVLVGVGLAAWRARGGAARLEQALSGLSVAIDEQARARLDMLGDRLRRARATPGAEQLGMQAAEQFDSLCAGFLALRGLLAERFAPGEITHARYLRAGEQVFLAALDDLGRTAAQLESLASVDIERLRAQTRMLERRKEPSAAEVRELETMRERMSLREEETEGVRALLASNEESLTRLSSAQAALARIKTQRGMAKLESDDAMSELEALSARAEIYSIKRSGNCG